MAHPFTVPLAWWDLGFTSLSLYILIHNARLSTVFFSPQNADDKTKATAFFGGQKPLQSGITEVEIFEVQLQNPFFCHRERMAARELPVLPLAASSASSDVLQPLEPFVLAPTQSHSGGRYPWKPSVEFLWKTTADPG